MNSLNMVVILSEVVALLAIAHLWLRGRMRWWAKLLWSVWLVVPCLGPLLYAFIVTNPTSHNEDPEVGPYSGG